MEKYVKYQDRGLLYDAVVKDLNLRQVEETCYPDTNGSYFITFSAKEFLIRYNNSRYGDGSELSIEVASNSTRLPQRWVNLSFLKNFIENAEKINPGVGLDLKSINEQNDFIKNSFEKIAEVLNLENYVQTIAQIKTRCKQEFIEKHPGVVRDENYAPIIIHKKSLLYRMSHFLRRKRFL